jgi:hypothetical protein
MLTTGPFQGRGFYADCSVADRWGTTEREAIDALVLHLEGEVDAATQRAEDFIAISEKALAEVERLKVRLDAALDIAAEAEWTDDLETLLARVVKALRGEK